MALGWNKGEKGKQFLSSGRIRMILLLSHRSMFSMISLLRRVLIAYCCDVIPEMINYGFRQYLVQHKYAGPGKVAINGGSNGGQEIALLDLHLSHFHRSSGGRVRESCTGRDLWCRRGRSGCSRSPQSTSMLDQPMTLVANCLRAVPGFHYW